MKRKPLPWVRIPIREQLTLLLLLATAIGMAILAVASYVTTYKYAVSTRQTRLTFEASLKASQVSSSLALMENSVQFTASRIVVQEALANYNVNGTDTTANWASANLDMAAAIGGPASDGAVGFHLLLQSQIFPASDNGTAGKSSLINTTNSAILGQVELPTTYANGTSVYLGDDSDLGYPSNLYPNFTYTTSYDTDGTAVQAVEYNGLVLSPLDSDSQALLIGPWSINATYALLSLTIPIVNNTSSTDVLGWLSVVMSAGLLKQVIDDPEGLDPSGELLIIRPQNSTNKFPPNVLYTDDPDASVYGSTMVNFLLPLATSDKDRHPKSIYGAAYQDFNMSSYPAVVSAATVNNDAINNDGAMLSTHNEAGYSVAVGFALVNETFVDWVVIAEDSHESAFQSVNALRRVIIGCLFGVLGGMVLIIWPLAHFASRPIRELRTATLKTVMPVGYLSSMDHFGDYSDPDDPSVPSSNSAMALARKEGFFATVLRRTKTPRSPTDRTEELRRQQFRIPSRVPDRKHVITDELAELTKTFNEMSDELMMQYERLEERVRERTAELELSKKAAEAANESKTLFIANISHELKTPLNGILGMCAVCMQEDDPIRLKRSLGIIYKSGDLLLNLLTDLLTFSKNQVGQQLSLDEKEFHLRDVSSQILAIFDKQATEGQIDLKVNFMRGDQIDQADVAGERVKDMVLWGDTHRILQVVINLVSNSLKFTPPHGSVNLNIKYLGETPDPGSRKTSTGSRGTKASKAGKRAARRQTSESSVMGGKAPSTSSDGHSGGNFARMIETERAVAPPGRTLMFEFEVVDTGPGIPEESHQKIFEPFVQGDLGLSKKYGGTGLGLSICSQLAGLMNGAMSLKSEVGKGSTFAMKIPLRHIFNRADSTASSTISNRGDAASTFSAVSYSEPGTPRRRSSVDEPGPLHITESAIPTSPKTDAQASQPRLVGLSQPYFAAQQAMETPNVQPAAIEQIKAVASTAGKIRVLVAEDNKVNQEVVLRMLKLEDIYDVTVAKDGQEALDLVKESMLAPGKNGKGPFNLIFMDVQMPNLDGLQSTKLIRECGFQAPIVALTAFAEESNVKDCLDSGMNHFLSKPIRRPALKKVLKEYCYPIEEVDEDGLTPSPTKEVPAPPKGKAAAQVTTTPVSPPRSGTPTSGQKTHHRSRSSIDQIDMSTNANGTTVIVVSRPGSLDLPRRSMSSERNRP